MKCWTARLIILRLSGQLVLMVSYVSPSRYCRMLALGRCVLVFSKQGKALGLFEVYEGDDY